MKRMIVAIGLVIGTAGCGVQLPPITITVPEPAPSAPELPAVPVPTAPEEPRAPEPPAVTEPEPAPVPLVNLNIVVHDAASGVGIPAATCVVGDDNRIADGSGFINFAVRGPVVARCAAGGYQARLPIDLPPGDHRVALVSIAPPPPPVPPTPAPKPAPKPVPTVPGVPIEACSARHNTGRISDGCLEAVTHGNLDYMSCTNGDAVACHRYVRKVAAALRTATGDPGWGLITKFQGQGCTMTACSQSLIAGEQKYGEDMVAYLPKGNPTNLWTGIDVIVGAGAPGARYGGGVLPPAVGGRPDNLWAPVP